MDNDIRDEDGFEKGFAAIQRFHGQAMKSKGFWKDREIPGAQVWVKLALHSLIMSESGEATTGIRKNLPDDHLPHRSMEACELADVVLRCMDYAAYYNIPLSKIILEKMAYNEKRPHRHGDKLA